MLKFLRFLCWGAIGLFLILFAASNTDPVPLRLVPLPWALDVPPWGILFAGVFIGLTVAGLVTSAYRLKAFVDRRQSARREAALEADISRLAEKAYAQDQQEALAAVGANQQGPTKGLS